MNISKEFLKETIENQQAVRKLAHNNNKYGFELPINEFLMTMKAFFTSQSYGCRIQNRIIKDNGWEAIKSSQNRGDAIDNSGQYNEIKVSFLTSNTNAYNLVQIRPYQNIDYYYILFVDENF